MFKEKKKKKIGMTISVFKLPRDIQFQMCCGQSVIYKSRKLKLPITQKESEKKRVFLTIFLLLLLLLSFLFFCS
jgi:hypothetical protein